HRFGIALDGLELRLENKEQDGGFGSDIKNFAPAMLIPEISEAARLDPRPQKPEVAPMSLMSSMGVGGRRPLKDAEMLEGMMKFIVSLAPAVKDNLMGIVNGNEGNVYLIHLLRQIEFPDPEARNLAVARLGHAMKHSGDTEGDGSYTGWLTRVVFQDIFEKYDAKRASRMLNFLVEGGSILDYEAVLAKDLPRTGLSRWKQYLPGFFKGANPYFERIQALPFAQEAKNVLLRWSYEESQVSGERPPYVVEVPELLKVIEQQLYHPDRVAAIPEVLKTAAKSATPGLRLARLHHVLAATDRLNESKLAELSDPDFFLLGRKHPRLTTSWFASSSPSQLNAYQGKAIDEGLVREIQKRLTELVDPEQAERRGEARRRTLQTLA